MVLAKASVAMRGTNGLLGRHSGFRKRPLEGPNEPSERMPVRTQRLLVNLGASQTRRRLKGHGFGVKKIETAGKSQAIITHTATGDHRAALHAFLADVIVDETAEGTSDEDRLGDPDGDDQSI